MKIALFASTGAGTMVLDALYDEVGLLVTKQYPRGPYPHFECEQIIDAANGYRIPIVAVNGLSEIRLNILDYDLLLSIEYHRLIPEGIYEQVDYAINIHPGKLPDYRGKFPVEDAIKAGDKTITVTAHHMTGEYDSGAIILEPTEIITALNNPRLLAASMMLGVAQDITDLIRTIIGRPQEMK